MLLYLEGCMLQTDPSNRPNINEVMFHLENIAESKSIKLEQTLNFLKKTDALLNNNNNNNNNNTNLHQNTNVNMSTNVSSNAFSTQGVHSNQTQNSWMGNAANLFKGNSIMRTIKDASSKVIDSVQ